MRHTLTGSDKENSYNNDYMDTGKKGEKVIKKWLRKKGFEVGDVTDNKKYWKLDIDLFAKSEIREFTIEAKTDTYLGDTGNILFEFFRIYHNSANPFYEGWFWRSGANWLYVYAPNHKNKKGKRQPAIYRAKFPKVQKRLREYIANYEKKEMKFMVVKTDEKKTTFNLVLPFRIFRKIFTISILYL